MSSLTSSKRLVSRLAFMHEEHLRFEPIDFHFIVPTDSPTLRTERKRAMLSSRKTKVCSLCCEEGRSWAVGPCDHPTCLICCARLRVLCRQKECPVCRLTLDKVVVSAELKPHALLPSTSGLLGDRRHGIFFTSSGAMTEYETIRQNSCRLCPEVATFRSFTVLRDHMRRAHELYYCELCLEGLKLFPSEFKAYSRGALTRHRRDGDPDDRSYRPHPLCVFCDERFLDNDALHAHLRRSHFWCHFCESDGKQDFYPDYNLLRKHFKTSHLLCEEGACRQEKFTTVFRTKIDLQAHRALVHAGGLTKNERRQLKKLDVGFTFSRQNDQGDARQAPPRAHVHREGRRGGGGGGRGGGRESQSHSHREREEPAGVVATRSAPPSNPVATLKKLSSDPVPVSRNLSSDPVPVSRNLSSDPVLVPRNRSSDPVPRNPSPSEAPHRGRSSPGEADQGNSPAPETKRDGEGRKPAPPGFRGTARQSLPLRDADKPPPKDPTELNFDFHVDEWPDLDPCSNTSTGNTARPPISAHSITRIPPGFQANQLPVGFSQAMPRKKALPLAGTRATKSTGLGTAPERDAPSRLVERELISQVRQMLGYDREKFHQFKALSGWYRNSEISAAEYGRLCEDLLGMGAWHVIGPRLAWALPDKTKRRELLALLPPDATSAAKPASGRGSAWGGGAGGRGSQLDDAEYPSLVAAAHQPDPPRHAHPWVPA